MAFSEIVDYSFSSSKYIGDYILFWWQIVVIEGGA
jgi:hypothetical protein